MSAGKTVGILIILATIILMFLAIVFNLGLPMFPFFRGCAGFGPMMEGGHFIGPRGFMFFPATLMFLAWIAMTIWVFNDAEKRRMNGLLWALLVFFGHFLALVVYLLIRNDQLPGGDAPKLTEVCPSCSQAVSPGFVYCPHCGTAMNTSCSSCKKPVEAGWQVCPYCGEKL